MSRGRSGHKYFVLTPENHFASRLPEFGASDVTKLVTPRRLPARFAWYLIAPEQNAHYEYGGGEMEHFLYVLDGAVTVQRLDTSDDEGGESTLNAGHFAFFPPGVAFSIAAADLSRVAVIKKRYQPARDVSTPSAIIGRSADKSEGSSLTARSELIPIDDPAYDFHMSLLTFEPGVIFSKVEIHDEEHGLYMTKGRGVYFLDGDFHEVRIDDFIYMAPYCPQYFYPQGPEPAQYLLYKDAWRDGF
jgi:(S)-ureidoglycine aminohydrolase